MTCPYAPAHPAVPSYDAVYCAMERLMPGWLLKQDELMSECEPSISIQGVQALAAKRPGAPLDDLIHEYFQYDWFRYHPDGDESW